MMTTRGERLCNPGNLKITAQKWQGKIVPSKDPTFETFCDPSYGIRAIAKILLTDAAQGINTVAAIIGKYAPTSENATPAYINAVSEHLKVQSDQALDLDDYTTMYAFVTAIIMHEQGEVIYSDDTINKGLNLAGIYNVPKPPLASQPEAQATAGAGAIAGISLVSTVVQSASPAIPLIQQIITVAPWVVGVAALLGAAYFAYIMYKKHKTLPGV